MQINIKMLQVRKSRSDRVHEKVEKRIENVRFTKTEKMEKESAGKRKRLVKGDGKKDI